MKELKIVEYNGKRILTTSQVAEFLGTDEKIIRKNFERNQDHYVVGKHYFLLEGDELKKFKKTARQFESQFKQVRILYLWTFDGCLVHYNNIRSATFTMLSQLADYFGIDADSLTIMKHRCQESILGEQLKNLLRDICPIISQFTIDGYRVDFYLPTVSIIIEYDEQHHRYNSKEDLQRQNYIKDRLKCTFIRVQNGYDFSLIANEIMIAVLKSKR